MKIRLIIDRLTGKAIMAGDKAIAVRSTDALNIQQTSELSQADYDALATKDLTTLYLITGTSGYVKAYIGDSPLYREPEPRTVSGTSAVVFSSIDGGRIKSLIRYGKCEQGSVPVVTAITQLGKCEQNGTPTPSAPVDIVCNNGAIKARRQSGLPLGYQMVEWLISAGAIRITGFKTKSTQEIKTVFYRETSAPCYLYSSDTSSSGTTNTTAYLTSTGGNWRWNGKTLAPAITAGAKTSVQSANGLYFNGSKWGSYDGGEFVSTNDLSVSSSGNTGTRIYSLTIREGEAVTLDLVPVQRLSDSAYGFYDKVSGNFYTNDEATITAGDPIDDPVEIYTDGASETLTVSGINLLDPSTSNIKIGQQVTANGDITSAYPNNWRTDYIPVVGGKTYAFWGRAKADDTISAYNRINWFTANKTHIYPRPSYTVDAVTVATAPSNAAFAMLSCSCFKSDAAITREQFDLFNWMFAETAQEIPYQPYDTPQTVTDVPMLLSTGAGGVNDEAEIISGIKTGKVGIKVFDGTETFTVSSSGAMITTIPDVAIGAQNVPMNTHFALESSATSITVGKQRFGSNGSQIYSANYYMKHTTITTVADFKAWLAAQYAAGTPVIVLYPLATETTGQLTAHPELTNGKYTTASAEGNVDDITVTVTRGTTSTPTPYNPIPVMCNNGEVTGQGASGTPEVLTLSAAGETDQTATVVDLLSVGDVKDEQDVITGEVARRCAACLYDGTQEVGDTYISSTGGKDIGAVIVYHLATPATEQVTPQPLICHMGTNEVESVCNVSDPEIKVTYPE